MRPRKRTRGGLSDEQYRNLRFRSDLHASGGRWNVFHSDEERALAWQEHRGRFLDATVLGRRCAAFWQYEAGVPAELRDFPPVTSYRSLEAAAAEHCRLARARDAWLLEHLEHHREGERDVLRDVLRRTVSPPPPPSSEA
jgi:hypothetical protein